MRRDSNINQFIPLHFYELSEKLPEEDQRVIVIYTSNTGDIQCDFALYWVNKYTNAGSFFIEECGCVSAIAWASFSPGWVTGSESFPEKWGSQ